MKNAPRHRRTSTKNRRRYFAVPFVAAAFLTVAVPASAHNHLLNPSGDCNSSGMGVSPGNSGEGLVNPGGHVVGQANADNAQGALHCQ